MNSLSHIIEGCKNNNNRYQKVLYEQFYGYSLKVVFRYIYKYENAVDVVNDGYVKLFRNLNTFKCENEEDVSKVFMGWLRRIMVNTAIDELRKLNMMPDIGAIPDDIWEEPDKSANADQAVLYKELITQVKKLPPSYRVVFNMYVIDGFTHQEIAEQLGISVGTSKSSLSKARIHLQKYINQDTQEIDAAYK
ncbi:MAG TPA: sigma-70 family RNA polymerase sigma factor [Chitinophagaceae bacterium]|nr:sigma-70 family RNA polymerase sigma factor [Chitinophagaceae bacterium]